MTYDMQKIEYVPRVLAILAASIGIAGIIGWTLHIEILKHILPIWTPIRPNAGVGIFLSGVGLFLLSFLTESEKPLVRSAVTLIGAVLFLLGLLTLIEYYFNMDFKIDNLFYHGWTEPFSIRMSKELASCFVLLGFAYMTTSKGTVSTWISQIIASVVFYIGFLEVIGYSYGLGSYLSMAIQSSIAMILVSSGMYYLNPHVGLSSIVLSPYNGGRLARRLLPILAGLIFLSAFLHELNIISGIELSEIDLVKIVVFLSMIFVIALFVNLHYVNKFDENTKAYEKELKNAKAQSEELQRIAEGSSLAKSAFLAAMSHEIRTPLNGVIGMASLLEGTPLTEEQKEYANVIKLSSESLLSVINDILDFSKIESGRMELDPTNFNIHTLVEDVVDLIASTAHLKGLSIGALIDPSVPSWVYADKGRIRQVLNNVIGNAVKFTENGEVVVRLSLIDQKQDSVVIRISVSDTGPGLSNDLLPHLFEPFTQADVSTSRRYGGSGLGLAISDRLIKLMNGRIDIHTEVGKGSTFDLIIPCKPGISDKNEKPEVIAENLKYLRILCLDDSEINCEIVQKQTSHWNMHCDVTTDPDQAIRFISQSIKDHIPYDLLLVDYVMPKKSGLDFVKELREHPEFKRTPVIIMTSLGIPMRSKELHELGVTYCLTKPIRQSKLYDCIITAMNPSEQKAELVEQIAHATPIFEARILLAEDNIVNQQVTMRMLKKIGYTVDAVTNGQEAIDALERRNYDLILMDCQMPSVDGYEATRRIRESEKGKGKHITIVALTAHAMAEDRAKCLASGMDDYLAKPIETKDLAEMLDKWINCETILDKNRLHDIFGDDKQALNEFLLKFEESIKQSIDELKLSLQNKDLELSRQLVHKLKGSAGNGGAVQIQEIATKIEQSLFKNNIDESIAQVKGLERAYLDLCEKIKMFI